MIRGPVNESSRYNSFSLYDYSERDKMKLARVDLIKNEPLIRGSTIPGYLNVWQHRFS